MRKISLLAIVFVTIPLFAQRTAGPQWVIPAAGAVNGVNNTFFRSDIALFNYRNAPQRVSMRWLPQNTSGVGIPAVIVTVPAFGGLASEDFVTNFLNQSGLGAIVFTAITDDNLTDTAGRLYVTARVWSPLPNSSNVTVSQTFLAVPTSSINNNAALTILGQRIDSRYRTNVGVVNLDTVERSFTVVQNSDFPTLVPITTPVTVQPLSMTQVALPSTNQVTVLQIVVTPNAAINPALWLAYGSSVDNVSGDSWSSAGVVVP
jgi:hypothetical protein